MSQIVSGFELSYTAVTATGSTTPRALADRFSVPVNVKDYGAKGDGVTDDTAAINAACAIGGDVVFPPGTYAINNLLVDPTGGVIHLIGIGSPTIIDRAVQTGTIISVGSVATVTELWITGINFSFQLQSGSVQGLQYQNPQNAHLKIKQCTFKGQVYNPLTPNLNTGPQNLLLVENNTESNILIDSILDDVYFTGGQNGCSISGARRLSINNVTCVKCRAFGVLWNITASAEYVDIVNFKGYQCGVYALSNSQQTQWAAPDPMAMVGIRINAYIENTGWGTFLSGFDGAVGSGKFGMDFTDGGANACNLNAGGRNNCVGLLESKFGSSNVAYGTTINTNMSTTSGAVLNFAATTGVYVGMLVTGTNVAADSYVLSFTGTTVTMNRNVSGTVSSSTAITFGIPIQPFGQRNIIIDGNYVTNISTPAVANTGIFIGNAENSELSASIANHTIRGRLAEETAIAWRSNLPQRVFDIVSSNGLAWLCMGDGSGNDGTTGLTAPPAGTNAALVTTTTSTVTSTNVIPVASATGLVNGMTLFAGTGFADGLTITNVSGLNITVSGSGSLASGAAVFFSSIVNDGTMRWACLGTDQSATSSSASIGIQVTSSSNVAVYTDIIGFGNYVQAQTANSSDNIVKALMLSFKGRQSPAGGGTNGVQIFGSGTQTISMVGSDIEAVQGVYLTASNTGTVTMDISGGSRIKGLTNAGAALRIDAGSSNVLNINNAYLTGVGNAMYISGGTSTVNIGHTVLEGSQTGNGNVVVNHNGGTNTINWGEAIINQTGGNFGGYSSTAGTLTSNGSPLRRDLKTAPVNGTTIAGVGERMILGTPTATEWAYICTVGSPTYTWKKLGYLSAPTYVVTSAAVNFNSANSDNAIAIAIPAGFTRYIVREVWISGASQTLTTATCGVFTSTGGGGTAIVTSGTAITVATASEGTANNAQLLAIATGNTESFTNATLQFRVQTAEGAAATATVTLIYEPLS